MSGRLSPPATECETRSTDWTIIGARIRQAAAMAGAVHLLDVAEARREREMSPDQAPVRSVDSGQSR